MKVMEYVLGVASVVLNDNNVDDTKPAQFLDYDSGSETNYTYYVFRMQYPGSYCQTSYCNYELEQKLLPNGFKIHGFWPSSTESNPQDCRESTFNQNDLDSNTLSAMNTYWPSDQGSNDSFWSHEWTKHGVCAENVPGYGSGYLSEEEFFSFVISMYNKWNPTNVLANAGIQASNSSYYHLDEINNAFQNAYGVIPATTCDYQDGKAWFMNMSLCFDLDLKPMTCPEASSSCRSSDRIYFGNLEN